MAAVSGFAISKVLSAVSTAGYPGAIRLAMQPVPGAARAYLRRLQAVRGSFTAGRGVCILQGPAVGVWQGLVVYRLRFGGCQGGAFDERVPLRVAHPEHR